MLSRVKRSGFFKKMKIYIEELRFDTIIGILDFERVTPQAVIIDLTIEYDYSGEFINYADVAQMIKKRMNEAKYLLLEDAINDLVKKLKQKFPAIKSLTLKITKPSIMPDCRVALEDCALFDS